jgi:hypothetical protein
VKARPATSRSDRGGESPADRTAQLPRHPQSQQRGSPRHPQVGPTDHHHHPQGRADDDPRHPQANSGSAVAARYVGFRSEGSAAGAPLPEHRRGSGERPDCRQHGHSTVPPAGALRPLARALLSVAAEVHAARGDPLGTNYPKQGVGLRMPQKGVVHPVRSGLRYGLRSPATPGRTPSGVASSQVRGAAPPPVVDPDCMGDCA